jgi:hypothetical protein
VKKSPFTDVPVNGDFSVHYMSRLSWTLTLVEAAATVWSGFTCAAAAGPAPKASRAATVAATSAAGVILTLSSPHTPGQGSADDTFAQK